MVASRQINREEVLLPVAVRRSKTPELKLNFIRGNENVTHSAQSEFSGRESKLSFHKLQIVISQTTDCHFANCRFSFRKLHIFISQTTDSHFANYRFSFCIIPFRFVSLHFVSQTTVSRFYKRFPPISNLIDLARWVKINT